MPITRKYNIEIEITVDEEDKDLLEVLDRNHASGALQRALTRKAFNDINREGTVGGARIIAKRAGLQWGKGYEIHHFNEKPGDNRRRNLGILSASLNRSKKNHPLWGAYSGND